MERNADHLLSQYEDLEKQTNTKFEQTANSISAEANRAQKAEGELDASLELKIGRDENDQVVSMINASADQITLRGNRLIIESNNFQLDGDGHVYIVESLGFKASAYGQNTDIISLGARGDPTLQYMHIDLDSVTDLYGDNIATENYVDDAIQSIPDAPVKKITASPTGTTSGSIKKAIRFLNVIGGNNGTYQIHGEVYTI